MYIILYICLMVSDGNEAVYTTLDVARQAQDNNFYPHKLDDPSMRITCLHKWPFVKGEVCLGSVSFFTYTEQQQTDCLV